MNIMASTTNHKVFHVKTEEEFDQILQRAAENSITVFVKFGAVWCGPCKRIAPLYEKLADIYNMCVFLSVDVDEIEAISTRYNIKSLPTFIVCRNNTYSELMKGANPGKLHELVKNQIPVRQTTL